MTYSLVEFKKSKNRIEKQFNNVVLSNGSVKKLVVDYPKINEYLTSSFPNANISDIPIFLANRTTMSKNGFDNINGCFVPHLQKILVCKKCTTVTGRKKTKYLELLSKKIKTNIDHEDIVLHELLHAVSFRLNRYNKRYKNNEEEFVFLNSFEFYRNKGMSDENIINSILICFCINNITNNYKEMQYLFTELKKKQKLDFVPWEKDYTEKEYDDFINEHADYLSDSIIDKARVEGKKILEIERSRKKTSVLQDDSEFVLSSEKVRSLDLEID